MKIFTIKRFVFALLAMLAVSKPVMACNLSEVIPLNIVRIGPLPNGPWVISFRLCVGMGVTGVQKGGDQVTSSMMLGFYDSQPGFLISAFTPNNLAGPAVGLPPLPCIMPGMNNGADPFFNLEGSIIYSDPGYYGDPACAAHSYGCVSTTTLCGPRQSYCQDLTVTVNQIPDSMRVFGAEGGGNPVGGCYPNHDMMIDFNSFLSVVWGEVTGTMSTAGVNVNWSTLQEINSDYFIVERAVNGGAFEQIGQVPAIGNSTTLTPYSFFDQAPNLGQNQYRIIQVDRTGQSNDSETIEVDYFQPEGLSWGAFGPNPTRDVVGISFYSPAQQTIELQVRDVTGKLVISSRIAAVHGGNVLDLDLGNAHAGSYYVTVLGSDERITRKLVKL